MYQDVSLLEMNHINLVLLPFPEVYAGFSILFSANDVFFFSLCLYILLLKLNTFHKSVFWLMFKTELLHLPYIHQLNIIPSC